MQIKPHKIIVPGCGIRTATALAVTSDADDLRSCANLRVALLDVDGAELIFSHVILSADQYSLWDTFAPSYHEGAHRLCAGMLGLILI